MKILFALLAVSLTISLNAADTWPAFQNGGRVSIAGKSTVQLGGSQWETRLEGYGQSSPIVWGELVYITTIEGDNKDQCHVTAYKLADGSRAWQYSVENASPAKNSSYISRAAPTPVADENGVICFFEGGNAVALTHDGKVRWERNLVADYGDVKARHGLSSSLEQDSDSVFVWVERSEEPYIVSLSKQTGETEWKSSGLGATSWASPRLVTVEDGQHLVLSAIGSIAGLDPETGRQLWLFKSISGNSTPTPMPLGDGRFLIGATVARGEPGGGRAAESNGVIQIRKTDDGQWTADYAWKAKRATSSFGSPIVHNGVAMFVNREGVLYGLDATSGEELFARRLKGSMWSTPIAVGDQVFFFERDGKVDTLSNITTTQKLTTWDQLPQPPKPDEPAAEGGRPPMFSGPVLYAATWCDDLVLLRRGDRLFAITIEPKTEKVE